MHNMIRYLNRLLDVQWVHLKEHSHRKLKSGWMRAYVYIYLTIKPQNSTIKIIFRKRTTSNVCDTAHPGTIVYIEQKSFVTNVKAVAVNILYNKTRV